jgi:hypothetical protein
MHKPIDTALKYKHALRRARSDAKANARASKPLPKK